MIKIGVICARNFLLVLNLFLVFKLAGYVMIGRDLLAVPQMLFIMCRVKTDNSFKTNSTLTSQLEDLMDKIKQKGSCSFIPLSAKHTAFHKLERHPTHSPLLPYPHFSFTPTLFPTLQKPVKNAISAQHSTSAQVPPVRGVGAKTLPC